MERWARPHPHSLGSQASSVLIALGRGGHSHSLFVVETGEENPLPTHPDVKPHLFPLLGLWEGQSHLQVRGRWPLPPGTGAGLGEGSSLLLQILLAGSIQKYKL